MGGFETKGEGTELKCKGPFSASGSPQTLCRYMILHQQNTAYGASEMAHEVKMLFIRDGDLNLMEGSTG